MALRSNATPVLYQPGKGLQLEVLESYYDPPLPETVGVLILRLFSITMSPVMDVVIRTIPGSNIRAVLKLYDRRFGTDLRDIFDEYVPHTAADETLFQSFVRRGEIGPFLRELEEKKKAELLPPRAGDLLDGTPEGRAKYEAALWQDCDEYFDCETEAYARLKDLQGVSIPRMYAHVRLVLQNSDVPPDLLQSEMAPYFEIKGVLLEWVPGYNLRNIATSPLAPPDPEKWQGIVQSAVDIVHDINRRGVIMSDCQPRNVIVDRRSQTPFIIDLAQCYFKDKLIELWEEWGWHEDEDWDPDAEYWRLAGTHDNPGEIGAVMANRLLRAKGMKLNINYPDLSK